MPNTREKLIKRLEQSLIDQETGREMRFVGGDTPIIANGVTLATDNNVGDKMTPTADKWIPVSEMVPESHVEPFEDIDGTHYVVVSDFVLGYTDKGQILCVQHEVGDERDWWLSYDCSYHTVTHWMPLPEPPKGE